MLRAAYFGQELLSTFNTSLGEVALIPATGGIFTIHLTYAPSAADGIDAGGAAASATASAPPPPPQQQQTKEVLIWDRKIDGGFPEAKVLKQRIRDYIDPKRDLGHSDKPSASSSSSTVKPATAIATAKGTQPEEESSDPAAQGAKEVCEDCA
jgi:predicted Rdx family selenoprotein